jgi:hypothetical protein
MKSKYGDDEGQHPLSLYSPLSLCRHHSLEGKLFVRLIVVLLYALSLSHTGALSLSRADALSRGCSLSRAGALSLADALSLTYPLSLSILWFVVVFTLVVFSSLTMASLWIHRAVVALRSFLTCLYYFLYTHLDLCIVVLYAVMYYKTSNRF